MREIPKQMASLKAESGRPASAAQCAEKTLGIFGYGRIGAVWRDTERLSA